MLGTGTSQKKNLLRTLKSLGPALEIWHILNAENEHHGYLRDYLKHFRWVRRDAHLKQKPKSRTVVTENNLFLTSVFPQQPLSFRSVQYLSCYPLLDSAAINFTEFPSCDTLQMSFFFSHFFCSKYL